MHPGPPLHRNSALNGTSVALGAWVALHNTGWAASCERRENTNLTCPGSAGYSWQTRRGASSWAPWIWHLAGSAGALDWPYRPPPARLVRCRRTIAAARMVRLLDCSTARVSRKGLSRFVVPNTHAYPRLAARLRDANCYGGQQQHQRQQQQQQQLQGPKVLPCFLWA